MQTVREPSRKSKKKSTAGKSNLFEASIAGTLLEFSSAVLPANLAELEDNAPDSFDDQRCGEVAKAICTLKKEGRPVSQTGVAQLVTFPDADLFISELKSLPLDLAELDAAEIVERYRTRRMAALFDDGAKALLTSPNDVKGIAGHVRAELDRLESGRNGDALTIRTPDELLAMQFDESDQILGDRLLSCGGSLVIAGPGSIGKSRLLLQLAVACRAGLPWIGFETRGQELIWLILQGENSNRRLQADFAALRQWIGESHWPQINSGIVIHTLEADADGFLSLDSEQAQRRIKDAIAKHKPDVVAWDSLYNFGIADLNRDEDMAATLLAISRLSKAGNPQREIIVLHHALTGRAGAARAVGFDRSSYGRNSKLLHQWTRAQLNLAPGQPDANDVIVCSCGKLNDGQPFMPFAVRLNPERMIYDVDPGFDLAAWETVVSGKADREPLMTPDRVAELCRGPATRAELVSAIREDCGCTRESAYRYIRRAEQKRKIKWNSKAEHYLRT
jgi:hypothetical protein